MTLMVWGGGFGDLGWFSGAVLVILLFFSRMVFGDFAGLGWRMFFGDFAGFRGWFR